MIILTYTTSVNVKMKLVLEMRGDLRLKLFTRSQ